GPANVDRFHRLIKLMLSGNGFLELIEIHAQNRDWLDARALHLLSMRFHARVAEQRAMNEGMQGFYSPIEHFGRAGFFAHLFNFESRFFQYSRGAAGAD